MDGRKEEYVQGFGLESVKEEVDCLEDWGIGWRIGGLKDTDFWEVFDWINQAIVYMVMNFEFSWSVVRNFFWLPENLLASQGGLCCMEWFGCIDDTLPYICRPKYVSCLVACCNMRACFFEEAKIYLLLVLDVVPVTCELWTDYSSGMKVIWNVMLCHGFSVLWHFRGT
jgi:hypothetical protein